MKTITVQIGNSDNKLSQRDWSIFVDKVYSLISEMADQVHFVGSPPTTSVYQNYAVIFNIEDVNDIAFIKNSLSRICKEFHQESIAWTEGDTIFIS